MKRENRNKRIWRGMVIICLIGAFAAFISCANGVNNKNNAKGPKKTPPQDVPTVGLNVCTNCHTGQTNQWMTGRHANNEPSEEITKSAVVAAVSLDNAGFPAYADFTDDTCKTCHDQLGDGYRLTADLTGNVPRPVIGCESCHGGGAEHYGIGEIPFPKPDHTRCGQCHNANFPEGHLAYHPTGANIVENYVTSPHFASVQATCEECHSGMGGNKPVAAAAATGSDMPVDAVCSRCHTDDGFKSYVGVVPGTAGHDAIIAALGSEPPMLAGEVSPVECRTCHDSHTVTAETLPRLPASTDTSTAHNPQSREFNTCTACHQLTNPNGTVMTDAFHDASVNSDNPEEVLTFNHAAVPGDTRQNTGASAVPVIYVKKGDDHACARCHNVHSADITINEAWRESGHGDLLGDPWTHYNWKDKGNGVSNSGRQQCERCHTSTGFVNLATNPATYNPWTINDYSYLISGPGTGTPADNGQNEVLYCWACHTEPQVGILRNPGQFAPQDVNQGTPAPSPAYMYVDMSNTKIKYPDKSSSNVCIPCHTGLNAGGNVWNSTSNFANTSFSNSHYLTAGANLFGAGGFEYDSNVDAGANLNYTNPANFKHDVIGSAAAPGTGDAGPCVECHMNTARPHLFMPVEEDEVTGAITAITSTTCVVCHVSGGIADELTAAELNSEREKYQDALKALEIQLQNVAGSGVGFYFSPNNPYIFTAPYDPTYNESTASPHCQENLGVKNWLTGGTSTFAWNAGTNKCDSTAVGGTAGTGRQNMGAAFNLNELYHDPGGFVHNPVYAKRLIYDSIDWVDDNSLDDSVRTTLSGLNPATNPYKANTCEYLLEDSTCATGSRP